MRVHACVCMCICACVCIHVERGLRLKLNVFLYIFSVLFKNYMFICFLIYWYVFPCTHIYSHILLSEDKSQELIPSWHHVGPRDGTQAFRLGSKCLHLPSHLHWALHCVLHLIHAYCSHVAVKSVGLLTIFDSKISLCFLPEFIGASLFLGSHHSPILAISETPGRLWMLCNSLGHMGQFLTWTLTCKIWNLFLYMSVIT